MNALLPSFVKLAYRKEPISSFILIVGAVDAVIGGVGERWTLLSFGLLVVMLGMIARVTQRERDRGLPQEERARRYLPPSPPEPPLPPLASRRHHKN
ncbi:MAG: hypothetical protein SW833_25865 [Cyanobacteriota bacterium]|nr:hypothetical protein [Cyanobacteriota bacterium]